MKFSQLRNLMAVVEAGTVRQAARNFNVSQSAITKSVKQLEDSVGVALLHRSAHGVVPTAAGSALLARAKAIESELRHARSDIENLREGIAGEIRVSASPTVAISFLPSVVLDFQRRRPKAQFHITEGIYPDVLPMVRMGELDLALCLMPERPHDETLHFEILVKDQIMPAVRTNHPLTRECKLKLADLIDRTWVSYRRSRASANVFEQTFRLNGLEPPEKAVECTSFAGTVALVAASDYISLLPKHLFVGPAKGGPVVPLFMDSPMPPWNVAVISRPLHTLSALSLAFLKHLRIAAAAVGRAAA